MSKKKEILEVKEESAIVAEFSDTEKESLENNENVENVQEKDLTLQEVLEKEPEQGEEISEELEELKDQIRQKEMFDETDTEVGLTEDIIEERVKQALESQKPKKKKKSFIVSLILLLVNIVFMAFIVKGLVDDIGDANFMTVIKKQGSRLWWLVGGLLIYAIFMFSQTSMYKVLIKNITGKTKWGLAYDVAVVGKYYDNVTPFAVGGQPMQILRLMKQGISPGVSTSIPIIKMILNQSVSVFIALMFCIFGIPQIPSTGGLNGFLLVIFIILAVVGLIISLLLVLFMILVSSGTLFTRSFVSGILRFLYKIKLVKNYRLALKKTMNQINEYRLSMQYLWKHKLLFFKMLGLCVLECLSYAIIPYFVTMAFVGNVGIEPFRFLIVCISQYYICSLASSFIPLPGGTGLIEIAFIFLFGVIVGDNIVWALLIWRFLTYYLILIHGFLHEIVNITVNMARNKKRKV